MPPPPSYEQLLTENAALREENQRLRQRLGMDPMPTPQPPQPQFPNATVHNRSGVDDKIGLFMSLFRGRDDVYAKRYHNPKNGAEGYVPACRNEWTYGVCDKKKYKCSVCPNRSFVPFNRDVVFNHLSGKKADFTDVAGLYPLTADECCYSLRVQYPAACSVTLLTAAPEIPRSLAARSFIPSDRL